MAQKACCTCATLLAAVPRKASDSEKPVPDDRPLDCCGRIICGGCIRTNPRFLSYCLYCQTPGRSRIPSAGTRPRTRPSKHEPESVPNSASTDPPPYSARPPADNTDADAGIEFNAAPPPYTPRPSSHAPSSPPAVSPLPGNAAAAADGRSSREAGGPHHTYILHYLRHHPHPAADTIPSLSLRYGVPAAVLRAHNRIPADADYLLEARQTILIPVPTTTAAAAITTTTTTTGDNADSSSTLPQANDDPPASKPATHLPPPLTSLSPVPVGTPAERARKTAVRRWMVACKEADYGTAAVYLDESGEGEGYDDAAVAGAVRRYVEDCAWEREHPLEVGVRDRTTSAGVGVGVGIDVGGGGGGSFLWRGRGKKTGKRVVRVVGRLA